MRHCHDPLSANCGRSRFLIADPKKVKIGRSDKQRSSPWRQGSGKAHGGGGLGLLITKRILQLHGSTIEALSEGGAMFSFNLPTMVGVRGQ